MQIHIYIYTCIYMPNGSKRHNDKEQAKTSSTKHTSQFIVRVRKGLLKVCVLEGVGDQTEVQYINPHSYGRQRCVFLVLQGCSTGGPGAHSAGFLYCILSATSLDPNSSGPQLIKGPEGPFGLAWLSLSHFVSNSNCLTFCLD